MRRRASAAVTTLCALLRLKYLARRALARGRTEALPGAASSNAAFSLFALSAAPLGVPLGEAGNAASAALGDAMACVRDGDRRGRQFKNPVQVTVWRDDPPAARARARDRLRLHRAARPKADTPELMCIIIHTAAFPLAGRCPMQQRQGVS